MSCREVMSIDSVSYVTWSMFGQFSPFWLIYSRIHKKLKITKLGREPVSTINHLQHQDRIQYQAFHPENQHYQETKLRPVNWGVIYQKLATKLPFLSIMDPLIFY